MPIDTAADKIGTPANQTRMSRAQGPIVVEAFLPSACFVQKSLKTCANLWISIDSMKKNTTSSSTAGGQEIVATAADFDEHGALTRDFLLRRGHCCQEGCRNCPYGFQPQKNPTARPRKK